MSSNFVLIRPYWLLLLIPLTIFAYLLFRRKATTSSSWNQICSPNLLPYLIHNKPEYKHYFAISLLLGSALCMIISLSGPSWSLHEVPTYQPIQPRVLLLDMSNNMLDTDLLPNRLARAKFKLHDLLTKKEIGQFGLIVYTGEPFIVSPLTDDSQTIDALLPMLTPDIMPVNGNRLDNALIEASQIILQAGYKEGNLLVLTGKLPTTNEINKAGQLNAQGIHSSILPILSKAQSNNQLFSRFAKAGGGQVLPYSNAPTDIESWINSTQTKQNFHDNDHKDIQIRQDQGRIFILPAILMLLPVFRRNWLQRIAL